MPNGPAVELFHIGAVAAFDLAVVAWCGDGNKGMADVLFSTEGIQGMLFGGIEEFEGELDAVIGLEAADGEGKEAEASSDKIDGVLCG